MAKSLNRVEGRDRALAHMGSRTRFAAVSQSLALALKSRSLIDRPSAQPSRSLR